MDLADVAASPHDRARARDEKHARPRAEGIVEGGLNIRTDHQPTREIPPGECLAHRIPRNFVPCPGETCPHGIGRKDHVGPLRCTPYGFRHGVRRAGGVAGRDDGAGEGAPSEFPALSVEDHGPGCRASTVYPEDEGRR